MNNSDARRVSGDEAGMAARGPNTGATSADDQFTGPDEGGLRGENTPYAGGYDRQPAPDMLSIDAARGHADATAAGPNSDADTLIDDPNASRDNRA